MANIESKRFFEALDETARTASSTYGELHYKILATEEGYRRPHTPPVALEELLDMGAPDIVYGPRDYARALHVMRHAGIRRPVILIEPWANIPAQQRTMLPLHELAHKVHDYAAPGIVTRVPGVSEPIVEGIWSPFCESNDRMHYRLNRPLDTSSLKSYLRGVWMIAASSLAFALTDVTDKTFSRNCSPAGLRNLMECAVHGTALEGSFDAPWLDAEPMGLSDVQFIDERVFFEVDARGDEGIEDALVMLRCLCALTMGWENLAAQKPLGQWIPCKSMESGCGLRRSMAEIGSGLNFASIVEAVAKGVPVADVLA